MPKYRIKNNLFAFFWSTILKNYVTFEISTLIFFYFLNPEKTKMPEFCTKNAVFLCFWTRI